MITKEEAYEAEKEMGRQEARREVAYSLLEDNYSIDKVSQYTGLSESEIRELINNLASQKNAENHAKETLLIGDTIAATRRDLNLSPDELSDISSVEVDKIRMIESGLSIDIQQLLRILAALGLQLVVVPIN